MRSNDGEGEDAKGVKAMQKYLEAGKVVTTHGVRGEMKLELWCDGVAFLKKVGRLYTTPQGGRCYKITSIRPQGQMALLQLEGVSDMDADRALRGLAMLDWSSMTWQRRSVPILYFFRN